jgi:DNA polymerase-3 subunit epsilon
VNVYDRSYTSIDIETTGVNPFKDNIIEIGLVKFTIGQSEAETFQTLVRPEVKISEQAFEVHGITERELVDKPYYEEIAEEVIDFIGDTYLVIQNPMFDLSFLQVEHRRKNIIPITNYSFDTVPLARKAFPHLINHKLETVATHLGIKKKFHRALDDALSCAEIFEKALCLLDPEQDLTLNQLKEMCGFDTKEKIFKKLQNNRYRGINIRAGETYEIRYIDSEGKTTERQIIPKNIYRSGSQTIIHAYCKLRDEERFFNVKRIQRISSC